MESYGAAQWLPFKPFLNAALLGRYPMVIQQIHPVVTWFRFFSFLFSSTYQNRHLYLLSEVLTFGFFKSLMLRHGPSVVCSVYIDNAGTFPKSDGHGGAMLHTVLNVNERSKPVTVIHGTRCQRPSKHQKAVTAPSQFRKY